MMIINERQFDVFSDGIRRGVIDDLVNHGKKFAPRLCQVAEDSGVKALATLALSRCDLYNLDDRMAARFLLEIMLTLGCEFDSDPQFPWARAILQDRISSNQVRVQQLHVFLGTHIERVIGPRNEHILRACRNFKEMAIADRVLHGSLSAVEILSWLDSVYPEKARSLVEDHIHALQNEANEVARKLALPADNGTTIIIVLMVLFGHGALADPMYPWLKISLAQSNSPSSEPRARLFVNRLAVYLSEALQFLERTTASDGTLRFEHEPLSKQYI